MPPHKHFKNMKQILFQIFVIITILLLHTKLYANNNLTYPDSVEWKDSIKQAVIKFISETEHWEKWGESWIIDGEPDVSPLIFDRRKDKDISECNEGIFIIIVLSSSSASHFLLLDTNSFQIVNMRNPFEKNVDIVLQFFEKNQQYTKEDIIFYLKEMIRIDKLNKNK